MALRGHSFFVGFLLLKVQNIRIIRQSAEEPPAAEYPEAKLQVNGKLLDLYSENRSGTVFSVRALGYSVRWQDSVVVAEWREKSYYRDLRALCYNKR